MPPEGPCIIGKEITIKGSLSGNEDLVVEGRVEGSISLGNHLTIERTGSVEADIEVQELSVMGELTGDVTAHTSVSINTDAKVVGNVRAPRVIIEDGARFRGNIEMDVKLPDGVTVPKG